MKKLLKYLSPAVFAFLIPGLALAALSTVPLIRNGANNTESTIQNGDSIGIGTTTPFAKLSIATAPGANGSQSTLFVIASSTQQGATTTLFSVSSQGNVVVAGLLNVANTITSGNIFDTAGAYRLTVTGGGVRYGADSPGDGLALLQNRTTTGLSRLEFGGSTSAFPALTFNIATQAVNVNLANGALGGMFGVGTSTPFAKFSVNLDNGETNAFAFLIASSTANATSTLFGMTNTGHLFASSTAPSVSSGSIDGTDQGGRVLSCSSTCTITFAVSYTKIPSCLVQEETGSITNTLSYTPTVNSLAVTQTGLGTFNWQCRGQ